MNKISGFRNEALTRETEQSSTFNLKNKYETVTKIYNNDNP